MQATNSIRPSLVASIRLHVLDVLLHLRYRGPNEMRCDARFDKGAETG